MFWFISAVGDRGYRKAPFVYSIVQLCYAQDNPPPPRLLCCRMWLNDSKDVARRMFGVGQPANIGDLHLWYTNPPAALFNFLDRLIE
jgi:hypothetical protein